MLRQILDLLSHTLKGNDRELLTVMSDSDARAWQQQPDVRRAKRSSDWERTWSFSGLR